MRTTHSQCHFSFYSPFKNINSVRGRGLFYCTLFASATIYIEYGVITVTFVCLANPQCSSGLTIVLKGDAGKGGWPETNIIPIYISMAWGDDNGRRGG